MSRDALWRRIYAIKRADKMGSFVRVLEAVGEQALAAEARQVLAAIAEGRRTSLVRPSEPPPKLDT